MLFYLTLSTVYSPLATINAYINLFLATILLSPAF
jgi:hypothetical protein